MMREDTYHNYYVIVREGKFKELQAILNSYSGNADIFVKLQENPNAIAIEKWQTPSQHDYMMKSTNMLQQDVIRTTQTDLSDCFSRFIGSEESEKECGVIFSIYANKLDRNQIPKSNDDNALDQSLYTTRYNFVVYSDIAMLMNHQPISGTVEEQEFHYFIYEVTCENCGVIFSLSTFGSGNPDLFINYGDQRIPSLIQYDIKSSTVKSEILTLDLNHDFFKSNKIKSMKGPYIIGVYGAKTSTYTLSVSQEEHPVVFIVEGYSIKSVIEPFDVQYFMFFNTREEKDFKIILNVKSGLADLFVKPFYDDEQGEDGIEQGDLVNSLPKSKRDSVWMLTDVDPKTSAAKKELLIVNQDKDYCSKCYFQIGVSAQELRTDFSLLIHSLDANFQNALLLKFGEVNSFTLKENEEMLLRFILDQKATLQINQLVTQGSVQSIVNSQQQSNIIEINDSNKYILQPEDANFQVGSMYYIKTKALQNSQFSLMLMQNSQILQISDGVPMKLTFSDMKDMSKYMIYSLPQGSFVLHVQVKSFSAGFFPRMYIKYYEDLDSVVNSIEFPPGGEGGFLLNKNWDIKLGIMHYQETFENITSPKAGLAITLFDPKVLHREPAIREVQVTFTTSQVVKLDKDVQQIGTIFSDQENLIYQIDESLLTYTQGFIVIEFSQCLGESEILFIQNPKSLLQRQDLAVGKFEAMGREYYQIPTPQSSLYIMVSPSVYTKMYQEDKDEDPRTLKRAQYLIKARYSLFDSQRGGAEYRVEDSGRILYDFVDNIRTLQLNWGHLFYQTMWGSKQIDNVDFHIVVTRKSEARLDSICALSTDVSNELNIAHYSTGNYSFVFKHASPGTIYYMNVIAKTLQIGTQDPSFIPYKPIEIRIPSQQVVTTFAIYLYLAIASVFGIIALYYWRKTKIVKIQLEFELADIRNVARVGSYERQVQQAQAKSQEKYLSLVQEDKQ